MIDGVYAVGPGGAVMFHPLLILADALVTGGLVSAGAIPAVVAGVATAVAGAAALFHDPPSTSGRRRRRAAAGDVDQADDDEEPRQGQAEQDE